MANPIPSRDARDRGCRVPPEGWWCSREKGHEGPCAARPTSQGDPLVDLIRNWMMSEDYPVSQWERDFAAAIRALSDQPDSSNEGLAELLREALVEIDRLSPSTGPSGVRAIDSRSTAFEEMPRNPIAARIDTALSTGRQA